jgi:hypothetical protein
VQQSFVHTDISSSQGSLDRELIRTSRKAHHDLVLCDYAHFQSKGLPDFAQSGGIRTFLAKGISLAGHHLQPASLSEGWQEKQTLYAASILVFCCCQKAKCLQRRAFNLKSYHSQFLLTLHARLLLGPRRKHDSK